MNPAMGGMRPGIIILREGTDTSQVCSKNWICSVGEKSNCALRKFLRWNDLQCINFFLGRLKRESLTIIVLSFTFVATFNNASDILDPFAHYYFSYNRACHNSSATLMPARR